MADCHPDQPHTAKGLCRRCWERQRKPRDPVQKAAIAKRYRDTHKAELLEAQRRRNKANPERYKRRCKNHHLLRDFGITLDQFEAMLESQGGVNASGWALHVDHDHATGRVRGLLCLLCNAAAGWIDNHRDRVDALLQHVGVL